MTKSNNTKKKSTNKQVNKNVNTKNTNKAVEKKPANNQKIQNVEIKNKEQKVENKKTTVKKEKTVVVPKTTMTKNDSEISKLIKIVLIVTAIMVVFYGITILVTKNKKTSSVNPETKNEKAVIQYDDIMIGTMLTKNYASYYVLIEEKNDTRISEYQNYMKLISAKSSAAKIFTANLTDSFNKKYLAKEANNSSDINEFRVSGTTLVEVKDGNITNVYSSYDEIRAEFNFLIS